MYKLYYASGAASMAVHATLREIGAPFDLVKINIAAGEQRSPEYLAINPAGVVPALIVDGKVHTESAALCYLLAERHPDARLLTPDTRVESLQWLVYLTNMVQSELQCWFYPDRFVSAAAGEDLKAAVALRLGRAWTRFEDRLAQSEGPYLFGERLDVADIYLGMLARWSRQLPKKATDYPHVRRHADAFRARPSWCAVSEIEGVAPWTY
ncbi:glutathione S-transferase family protein [Lacibacterium aquatile]|uniref:Glutathione S-transferase family protein n=1 Tax=Lacibacterium aquatile TaxID=1168082 RepID=A0ABW5DST7_9PROT